MAGSPLSKDIDSGGAARRGSRMSWHITNLAGVGLGVPGPELQENNQTKCSRHRRNHPVQAHRNHSQRSSLKYLRLSICKSTKLHRYSTPRPTRPIIPSQRVLSQKLALFCPCFARFPSPIVCSSSWLSASETQLTALLPPRGRRAHCLAVQLHHQEVFSLNRSNSSNNQVPRPQVFSARSQPHRALDSLVQHNSRTLPAPVCLASRNNHNSSSNRNSNNRMQAQVFSVNHRLSSSSSLNSNNRT